MTSDYEFRNYETIKVTQSYFKNRRGCRGMRITWGEKIAIHLQTRWAAPTTLLREQRW